jgi:ATP-dependent RNA helicase DHX57
VVSRSLQGSGGSLLIFMPGVGEIARLCSDLSRPTDDVSASLAPLHVLALHGALPASEQSRVFGPPPKGTVKVIVATNVAETSITIPDCTVVIDTARAKQVRVVCAGRAVLLRAAACAHRTALPFRNDTLFYLLLPP